MSMTLFQMSLSGGVMIAVIALLRTVLLNRLPKGTLRLLWIVVLLRLLIPVTMPSTASVYSMLDRTPIAEVIQGDREEEVLPAAEAPQPDTDPPQEPLPEPEDTPAVPAAAPPATSKQETTPKNAGVLTTVWAVGAIALAGYFSLGYLRGVRRFRESLRFENDSILWWKKLHPLRRSYTVRQLDRLDSPLTYGIWKPVILLPGNLNPEDTEKLDYVLQHEWTHIRRFDNGWKLLFTAALCIHWFNPLVWVMYLLANQDMELACDEEVLRWYREHGKDARKDYALTLIGMEEGRSYPSATVSYFSKNKLEQRIRSIVKNKKATRAMILGSVVLVLAVVCLFGTSKVQKLSDALVEDGRVTVYLHEDVKLVSGEVAFASTRYEFSPDAPEVEKLREILGKYTYRPGWNTLTNAITHGGSYGNDSLPYLISMYSAADVQKEDFQANALASGSLSLYGDGQAEVNLYQKEKEVRSGTYRVGVFGNGDAQRLMQELYDYLQTCNGETETDGFDPEDVVTTLTPDGDFDLDKARALIAPAESLLLWLGQQDTITGLQADRWMDRMGAVTRLSHSMDGYSFPWFSLDLEADDVVMHGEGQTTWQIYHNFLVPTMFHEGIDVVSAKVENGILTITKGWTGGENPAWEDFYQEYEFLQGADGVWHLNEWSGVMNHDGTLPLKNEALERLEEAEQEMNAPLGEEGTVKTFLTQFYTTNYHNRYDRFQDATEEETGERELQRITQRYYGSIAGLVTDKLLDKLQANREPIKYDKLYWEDGTAWGVVKVTLEPKDENGRMKYQVLLKKDISSREQETREGVIGLDAETGLVNYFWENH